MYETYNFQRTKVTDSATGEPADGLYVVHRVTGGRMSVMNDEFTALNVGTYRFRDYIIDSASGDEVYSDKAETYSISVTSDETPVIEALGLVPTYSDTDVEVKLPLFVALTEHANITPDVTVTDKDGENVLLTEVDEDGDDINTSGTAACRIHVYARRGRPVHGERDGVVPRRERHGSHVHDQRGRRGGA